MGPTGPILGVPSPSLHFNVTTSTANFTNYLAQLGNSSTAASQAFMAFGQAAKGSDDRYKEHMEELAQMSGRSGKRPVRMKTKDGTEYTYQPHRNTWRSRLYEFSEEALLHARPRKGTKFPRFTPAKTEPPKLGFFDQKKKDWEKIDSQQMMMKGS